jgi:copper chaperone CopZ
MTTTEIFYAENIRCGGCVNTIQTELNKIPGVQGVDVSVPEKKIAVMGIGIRRDLVTKALKKMGYPESGHNSIFRKAISLVSCSAGK